MMVDLLRTPAIINKSATSRLQIFVKCGFLLGLFFFVFMPVIAQHIDDRIADMMTSGWRSQTSHRLVSARGKADYGVRHLTPTPAFDHDAWQEFRQYASMRFDLSPTRVVLVARSGVLQFEKYLIDKASERSTPIGNSISKSLVSLAVGKALCLGALSSLDAKVGDLVNGLQGTSWGDASLRDTLRMASGAFLSDSVRPTGWRDEEDAKVNRAVYSRQLTRSYIELMKRFDEKKFPAGSQFNYNNYDTVALVLAVESATRQPFHKFFEQTIWQDIGAEADGAWVTNEKGEVAGYFGFSARPRDWIRLGLWVLENREKNDCFGQYLREATSHQITANWLAHRSYGYQIWTQCTKKPGSFCFLGNHGQQLIFDPSTRTVLYVHATSNATNMTWREVFNRSP